MRRRPGIQGLQKGAQTRVSTRLKPKSQCEAKVQILVYCCQQDQYKVLGEHVQQTKLEHMKSQMVIFKKSLEEFAIKHRCADGTAVLHIKRP